MRLSLACSLLGTTLLMAGAALAHDDWRGRDDRYSGPRDPYARGSVVSQVLAGLQRIERRAFVGGHNRRHFERAQEELWRFESRWREGRFDKGRLDRAIDNLKHLADARELDYRSRSIIARHIEELRMFRASRGRTYGSPYGYGYRRRD